MPKLGVHAIRDRAIALLATHSEGLRYSALVRAISAESPETPAATIHTQVAQFPRDRPHLVHRPERGLFRLVREGATPTREPDDNSEPSLPATVEGLLRLGFVAVGLWESNRASIHPTLHLHGERLPCLYAFTIEGEVKYVGKSRRPLGKRLANYVNPGSSQSTNIRNNAHIRANIEAGRIVAIYALVDWEPVEHGGLPVNVAAGLEDEVVARMRPAWNA